MNGKPAVYRDNSYDQDPAKKKRLASDERHPRTLEPGDSEQHAGHQQDV
ncbi:MAG: hypothetical protein IPL59_15080 [Candidatus Competibacteraceae bacterium]|nr:hypothetical protein [Candidatus Competibacteraceae bacterium]